MPGASAPICIACPSSSATSTGKRCGRRPLSGNPRFFLGTDSAPHRGCARKESACGCAGVYTAPAALELYAEVFEEENALDRLEAFAAFHGPDFYGMERNSTRVELVRESWTAPARFAFGGDEVVPIRAGERVRWKLAGNGS